MGTKARSSRALRSGPEGDDILERLTASLPAVGPGAEWRDDVLADLAEVRDVLISERAERSTRDGCAVLRERSHLLSELATQRLQVMASPDVDRLAYDLCRLATAVRAHLLRSQGA